MLNQTTIERLRALRLRGMADALAGQLQQPDMQSLSFEERLGLLVDLEWAHRQNRRLARLLKAAKLRLPACMEDIDYTQPRGLDQAVMRHLATCRWVREHQHVLIVGPTGVGKTYIACALANAACRQGFSTRYYRTPRLLTDLLAAKADGSYPRLMSALARTELLVLDDWGLSSISAVEARDLLEIVDDRTQSHSTIVASQLPIDHWYGIIGDPTVADALLDRLIHQSHKLTLKGESMRKVTRTELPNVSAD